MRAPDVSVSLSSCLLMPSIPAGCLFWQLLCGLLQSALRTSRAAQVDYQSVIHHFDGLLQPHSDPSLSSCLHVWPTRQLKSRTHQVASCNWIFYPDADRWEKKRSDCENCLATCNSTATRKFACGMKFEWHTQRATVYGVCSVWSMEHVACVGRKPHNATNLMGQHNNFPLCHCHAPWNWCSLIPPPPPHKLVSLHPRLTLLPHSVQWNFN